MAADVQVEHKVDQRALQQRAVAGQHREAAAGEPRARLEYVSVTDADTLERLDKLDDRAVLIAVAARIGQTRLIDNIVLNKQKGTGALKMP